MSTSDDSLWSELEEVWRHEEPAETDESLRRLGRRVRRRARALWWIAATEIVTGLLLVAFAVHFLRTHDGAFGWMTFGAILGFVLAATGFAWWNRRGTWRAAAKRPADYLALERRQLDIRLRALRFGFGLLAAELVFFLIWIPWAHPSDSAELLFHYAFLLLWTALFALVLHRLRRRARRERLALERLRRELQSDVPAAG